MVQSLQFSVSDMVMLNIITKSIGLVASEPLIFLLVQKHLRWTMDAPDLSFSCFEINILWKVGREATIELPINTEYFRSRW